MITGFNISRAAALTIIVALHVEGAQVINRSVTHAVADTATKQRLVTVFIQPRIRVSWRPAAPDLSRVTYMADQPTPALHIDSPAVDFDVSRNDGAAMAAPTLDASNLTDIAPYIARAALLPGNAATTVLRIEVLESGAPGRIEVDTSSGSRQLDQVAVDYARTQHWYAGRVKGVPHVMWIRWGVRLRA